MHNKNEIKFEFATEEDIGAILDIIYQRSIWLKEKNINQWKAEKYLNKYDRDYFLTMMNTERLFVAKKEENAIGVVLLKAVDSKYWGNDDNEALYIYHLATRKGYKGLGKLMIAFCFNYALENNKKYLRLDCKKSNNELNDYYEKLGFVLKKQGKNNRYSYNLRELELTQNNIKNIWGIETIENLKVNVPASKEFTKKKI